MKSCHINKSMASEMQIGSFSPWGGGDFFIPFFLRGRSLPLLPELAPPSLSPYSNVFIDPLQQRGVAETEL